MTTKNSDSGQIAALAVFRDLYESRADVFSVISAYLCEIIVKNGMYSFTTNQINSVLKELYEFDIPDGVIATSLGRIKSLNRVKGHWHLSGALENSVDIQKIQNEILIAHTHIKDMLLEYANVQHGKSLLPDEKIILLSSFSAFLVDEKPEERFLPIITGFIIKNQTEIGFIEELNKVREGLILYTGLRHNSDINEQGTWNSKLTIFFETELLFNLAGYNGEVCKKAFKDMYRYIVEANTHSKKPLIELKYFPEVKREFDGFFKAASDIIGGKEFYDPSKSAMMSIINGCTSSSDVLEKKARFYDLLQHHGILEEDVDCVESPETHKYCIVNDELCKHFEKEFPENNVDECLSFLNKIASLRKNKHPKTIQEAKFVLITGKYSTLSIAKDPQIKENGSFQLATTLNFFVSKLWFKLNRGFGKGQFPSSFDVVAKAQMALANKIGCSLHTKFVEYQDKIRQNKLSPEQAAITISLLRREARRPENISIDNINDELKFISEEGISRYTEEYSLTKQQIKTVANTNDRLVEQLSDVESQLQSSKEIIEIKNNDRKQAETFRINTTINKNLDLIAEFTKSQDRLSSQIEKAKSKSTIFIYILRSLFAVAIPIYFCIAMEVLFAFRLGYDFFKPVSFFGAVIVEYGILLIISFIIDKKLTPKDAHSFLLSALLEKINNEYHVIYKLELTRKHIDENDFELYEQKILDLHEENDNLKQELIEMV